jgi:hypothetical protein
VGVDVGHQHQSREADSDQKQDVRLARGQDFTTVNDQERQAGYAITQDDEVVDAVRHQGQRPKEVEEASSRQLVEHQVVVERQDEETDAGKAPEGAGPVSRRKSAEGYEGENARDAAHEQLGEIGRGDQTMLFKGAGVADGEVEDAGDREDRCL